MDDGSQKLLDVIDDPSALESFLGLGEGSDRATLESIVDSLQQGLLEVAGARHSGSGPTQGSLVLTQQQLQQLHHFQSHHLSQQQSASVGGVRQHAVTFTLPSHTAVSSAGTTISSSGTSIPVSTHHFVLAPFPHQAHPATSTPASHCYTTAPISSAPPTMLGSLPINMGPNSSAISGIQIGGSAVGSSGITIGTSGPSGIPGIPVSSGAIFGTSSINLGHSGVLVGPSGTVFQPSALPINTNTGSSPGSPFSVPTRSPAPHAPPTPSPSPLPLRSPAHPPSPTPSPYHSQMQSPQNPHAQSSAGFLLKDGFSMVQPQPAVQGSTTGHHTNFVLSTRDAYTGSTQQHGPVVVLPHQRGPTNTSPQSPYQSQPSPHCPPGGQLRSSNTARSPAPSNASGALTPAPSPSPQHRSAPSVSPVVRSTTPQPGQATVIHQTLAAGLQQFPVVPSGGTTMLQAGNHQLLQIIHHNPSSVPTATFPSHTQIITTAGPGPSMHLQQAPAPNVSMTPSKPKQPPQILPKPPGSTGMVSQGSSHTKLTSSSRGNITTTTQHQGLHTQHTTTGAQMVIGQANQTAMIPTAQGGTLLLNQMIPGLTQGAPVLVQQNANGGMQLILRPPTPGSQGQAQGSKGQPMLISGPQIVHNATASRHQAMQPSQVLRLLTTHGAPLQLQQIQTPNGPTLIAVPSQALSFQHLSQLATAQPQPQQQQVLGPPQQQQQQHIHLQQQQAGRTANTFQIQTPGGLLPTMLGTLPTHMMQSSPSGTATCNGNVGGHSGGLMHHLGVPNSSTTNCVGAMGAQHAGPTLQLSNTGGSNPSGGTVITQHSGATTGQEHFSPVTTPGGGMVRTAMGGVPAAAQGGMGPIGQQGNMMVIPPPVLAPPKKKPKKKKKKKKDEEPKLDLANLMKLSGIDDEDGMTMYDPEEQTNQSQQQQQQVIPGGSPGSAGQTQDQQSQLLTQLHTQGGGQPSFKLALEDGKVIFQPDSRGVNSGTSNSTSLLLQNLISSQTQSGAQQSMAAAHSQLTALLGNSSSNQQHVVLSQLLQQSCPSSLPQLVSTGTNTTSQACGSPGSVGGPTGSFNHSLEQTNKTVSPTLTRDAFTEIQPGSKTVVTSSSSRNSFSNLAHGQQHVSGKYLDRMSISLGSGPNAPALLMNRDISNVTSSGLHGATHTPISMMVGENNASGSSGMPVHNSTKTVVANNNAAIQNLGNSSNLLMNSDSSPNLVLSRNSSMSNVPSHSAQANAPIVVSVNSSRSPTNSLRGCGSGESVKVVSPANSCLDSSTNNKCSGPGPVAFVHPLHHCERPVVGNSMTQTENLIEPSPLQQSKINDSFFPPTSLTHAPKTTVSNTDTSQAFFNLQSFPGLAPSGGTMPLMAACSTTGSGGYTGAEQLVIAHPGGLSSVVATPQLLQCLQQAQGLNMQLTPNMLNKALSGASFTFSSGGGTILIGGDSYNSPVMAGQTKMTSPLNNTKTTLQQQPPQSVLLQQLNTGVRRCSSDSNSSLSLGSPPPVVNQHQSPQILNHHRKGHQSIETQTVSTNPSFPNTFLDSIVQSHPSLVVNKLGNKQILNIGPVRKPKKPKKNDRNSIKVTPSMNVMPAGLVNSANMQNLQQRVCPNQIMVDPIKTNLHDRLFTKSTNLNSQNIMMGSVSTAGDLPCSTSPSFFATSQPYTTAPSRTVLVTSTVNSTVGSCQNPPLNVLCHNSSGHLHTKGTTGSSSQFGRSVATQSHTNVPTEPSLGHVVISSPSASLALGNSIVTTTASLSTKVSVTNSILTSSQPHACASNTVNCSPGGVPHLVPFPPSSLGGPSAAPGTTQSGGQVLAPGSIIQKVQTIQLTPQNQKHLKAVQLQIESLQNKKQLTPGDSAALQRLYDEQKRILATGKVVPTIPGQHAQGLHFNPPALDGDNDIYSNRHSTYLADLLRHQVSHQSNVSSHHQQQQQLQPQGPAVRYHHQVGNQVIPFPPPNHHHKNSTSSITPTTASHTGYRITPAVVQCHGTQTGVGECHQTSMAPLHVDSSSQASLGTQGDKEVELVPVPVPKMSVTVSPIPPPPNKCHSPVVMCEKGTSPIQVQVGTQTALPCEVSPRHKLVPCLPAVDVKPPLSPQVNKTASVPVCVNNSATINSGGCNSSVSTSTTSTVKLAPHLNKPQLTGLAPASPSARAAKSPLRPTISRCDLIEQQLKTDKAGAHAPDTSMPFRDRGDACKRLVRYHVYNEQQVLSQQDLEKADEIFEATAKHLLDKFRQMMNKYRYLLHMESMREVNTSELIMIDRMFVAEEHNILERLKQDTVKVKEEPSTVTVKMEPGTDLREVRVVVQDVMKNQSIKRELEEDHKVTVTAVGSSKRSRPENDEWLEVQRETGRSDIKTEGSGGCAGDSSVLAEDSRQRTSVGPLGQGGTGRDRPRDEGGGEPKRKEGCDSSEPVVTPHRKKRHKPSDGTDDGEGCDDDELNAQVQSAIDSILNLQRSEDGFELPSSLGAATEHAPTGISQDMDGEDTQQFMSPQDEHLLNNGVGDSPEALVVEFSGTGVGEDSGASSDNPDDDPALDEAVRSILTS